MKLNRKERLGALMKILTDKPNRVFTYNYFTEMFQTTKPSISEDIVIAKDIVKKLEMGEIITISGAAGGVKFLPKMFETKTKKLLERIAEELTAKNRLITGGFIYMIDLLYNPDIVYDLGKVFATKFQDEQIDYVVTVETKGIPIALMTAKALNVPLVIIRRNTKVTEGATVSINYVTGSTGQIQTMSLARRAMREGARVLVVDDFMKAGGTAKGVQDMMREFKAEVVGTGVLIATEHPREKLVEDYFSLLVLKGVDQDKGHIDISPDAKMFAE